MEDFNLIWQEMKVKHPVGSTVKGVVVESKQFGLFIDIGYGSRPDGKLMAIVEVVASRSLPKDTNDWPKVGDIVEGVVIFFRHDKSKEIDLRLIRVKKKEDTDFVKWEYLAPLTRQLPAKDPV